MHGMVKNVRRALAGLVLWSPFLSLRSKLTLGTQIRALSEPSGVMTHKSSSDLQQPMHFLFVPAHWGFLAAAGASPVATITSVAMRR
jgi:hypothetical protein